MRPIYCYLMCSSSCVLIWAVLFHGCGTDCACLSCQVGWEGAPHDETVLWQPSALHPGSPGAPAQVCTVSPSAVQCSPTPYWFTTEDLTELKLKTKSKTTTNMSHQEKLWNSKRVQLHKGSCNILKQRPCFHMFQCANDCFLPKVLHQF